MKVFSVSSRWSIAALLVVAAACSSHSPSEPTGTPANPKVPAGTPTYNVTVTARPGSLTIGQTQGSTITVSATNTTDGSSAPNLTPITITASLGAFNSASGSSTQSLQLINGQAQILFYAGTTAGQAQITATLAPASSGPCASAGATPACVGSGATTVNIVNAGTFYLNAVSPSTGDPAGGYPVTITGGGFVAPISVAFNGSSAAVTAVKPNAITVIAPPSSVAVPAGTTLPINITVNNNIGGTVAGSATLSDAFTYVPGGGSVSQPVIFSVTPTSGSNQGNTVVTIIGQGFVSPVQVLFGIGSSASSFNGVEGTVQSVTATKIVVLAPPAQGFGQNNTNQLVSILVKNVNNGFSTIDPAAYKYGSKVLVTSAGPTQTLWDQQVTVTIYGQGFEDPVAVSLGGFAAQVLSVSGTEIQVLSPIPSVSGCSSISGAITVTNINTGDSGTGPNFTYQVLSPIVSSLSPDSGTGAGGTSVLINGRQFDPPVSVTFGQTPGSNVNATTSSVSVTVPPFTGTYTTQACTGTGGATGTMDLPSPVSVVVTNLATGCTTTLTNGFIYDPPSSTCMIQVTKPVASFSYTVGNITDTSAQVIFQDTSTNNPTSWGWKFGDPADGTSSMENPVYLYQNLTKNTPYSFVVTLTVTNGAGTSSVSQFVTFTTADN